MRSIDRSNSVAKRPSASASATTATTATSSSSSSAASSTRSSTIRSTAAEGGSSMTCTAAATAAAAGNAFCRPPPSSSAEAARNKASREDIASTASAEIPPLLAHLSTQFVTATRHHLALGALQYQRCSYRSSTEHYQRAINFLMRREDALARHSHDGSGNAAFRHQHRQQQRAAIEDELAVEIEKMEFYTYVLCLNNRRDMDVLRNNISHPRPTPPVTTLTTTTATSTSTTSTSAPTTHHPHLVRPMRPQDLMPRCRHAPVLPPPRLAFYLDEHNASYILDSHVRAHQVLASNNIDTAANHQGQGQDPDEQQTIHLLQAYVMYNLALCHVALGSYSEALNLLQMVGDVASTTTGSTSTSSSGCDQNTITTLTPTIASTRSYDLPAELGDIMGRYQSFVKEVRVAAAAAAAATSSSTTATTTTNLPSSLPSPGAPTSTAHNNDDDMDVDRDDDDDGVDEEDGDIPLSLPASAA